MKKILIFSLAAMALVGCDMEMDLFRSDTMTSDKFREDPGAATYTTDGNYALFKDMVESYDSANSYVRHYFQMAEFRGDNCTMAEPTTDPLYRTFCYDDDGSAKNNSYLWYIGYKIIFGANSNIESIQDGFSVESDYIKGENLFLRALVHFHLVNIYAKPYSCGRDNLGVVLRTSTDCSVTKRATVGEVYDQVVADLIKAAQLMEKGKRRGDAGYASREAALGLLSRVYLYMDENDKCIEAASQILASDPFTNLDSNVADYFKNARTSHETLFCIAHAKEDTRSKSAIGSMYYATNGMGSDGWAQIYYSDPLIELFERFPNDKRFTSYFSMYKVQEGQKMIHWPIDEGNYYRANVLVTKGNAYPAGVKDNGDGTYSFTHEGKNYTTTPKQINKYLTRHYINFNGKETQVYVRPAVDAMSGHYNTYPLYLCSKFSGQDGDPMLSSPVFLRYSEVVLNRAEAYAKTGQKALALKDLNAIRKRAGIPEMTDQLMADLGHTDLVEVILEERRLELHHEGHRAFDVWRNKGTMDREFAGYHPWGKVEYTDNRIPHRIPFDEISASGIPQNE